MLDDGSLSAEHRRMKCLLIFQRLPDGEENTKASHKNNNASIVIVVVGEPEDDREHLKYVKGVEGLKEEQRNPAFDRHIDLVVAVHQTSGTVNN